MIETAPSKPFLVLTFNAYFVARYDRVKGSPNTPSPASSLHQSVTLWRKPVMGEQISSLRGRLG